MKEHRSGTWTPNLTDAEKKVLFEIAEDTLKWCVGGTRKPFDFSRYDVSDKMKTNMATFVTLKIDGDLRGCIGTLEPREALYLSVHRNAINASRDSRFPMPVQPQELPLMKIHVSILSPIVPIGSLDEFKIGENGIIMEKDGTGAVFLPEVALEQRWSKEQTLSHLSNKAGLSPNAWKQGARFRVFSSVVLERD